MRGQNLKLTWCHDAGAYSRCSHCGRYSDDSRTIFGPDVNCDCGSSTGWCGSFEPPTADSQWSDHNRKTKMIHTHPKMEADLGIDARHRIVDVETPKHVASLYAEIEVLRSRIARLDAMVESREMMIEDLNKIITKLK